MTSEFRTSVTPRNRANFRRLKTNSIQSVKRWEKENELLYAMMEDESEWLGRLFPDVVISPEFFFYALEDGSLLCRLANYIQEKAEIYGQNHNVSVPGKKFRYHSMGKCGKEIKLFRSRENVQQFLTWCRSHGLPEAILFESNDVVQVDECREGCRGVIICLMEIVRRTWKFELDELPQLIQLEKEIEDEEAGTTTDLCPSGQEQITLDVESFDSSEIDKLSVRLTEPDAQSPNSLDSDSGVESVFDQDEGENSAYRLTEFTVEETEETTTDTRKPDPQTLRKDPKPSPKNKEPKRRKELSSLLESTEPKTELDKQVCKIAKDYNIKLVHRLKEGKYIILGRIMFVRMLNDHMLVRIGGGWDTLEHYLMTHAPKQASDIVQSPSDEVSASPRNSISSPISGSLSNLVNKARHTDQSGVTRSSPVILPQGNQQGGASSAKVRDRVKKKLSLTEKDERDITDAIRKLESSVSQNLASRPASFTSKTFFQLKSRFDKVIFGSSRRISSPDLLAPGKKVESRRFSYTMADVTSQGFDGFGEAKQEAIANNNDTKFKQYESDEANESAIGKVMKGCEAQDGDLLGEGLLQANVMDSEHVTRDETDGAVPVGGLLLIKNESEPNYTDDFDPQNGSESSLETTAKESLYDPHANQEVNAEHLLLNPSVSQEPSEVDKFVVESSPTLPAEEQLISLDSAPSDKIEERPGNLVGFDFAVEVASEVKEESPKHHHGSDTADENMVGPSLMASEQELTQQAKSQEMVESQPEELTPEDKAEDLMELQGEDTLEFKREEIVEVQQEETPAVQSEEITATQQEGTPEVHREQVEDTQQEGAPEYQTEQITETQEEGIPEVHREQVEETQQEGTPEYQTEQITETQEEGIPEVHREQVEETQQEGTPEYQTEQITETPEEGIPEVQTEQITETQEEGTPEVQTEQITATQQEGTPENKVEEIIETHVEGAPEITTEDGTHQEDAQQVNREEIGEALENSVIEEGRIIEEIKYNESSTKQDETPKEIEEGVEPVADKETVVEEVSSEKVTVSGEPTTLTQTHEIAKEEQPQKAPVEKTQTNDEKASEEAKVEGKAIKKAGKIDKVGKTMSATTETRSKSPMKAPGKPSTAKKSAIGARPSSPAKSSSTTLAKAPATSKATASKAPTTKTAPSLPLNAKKPAPAKATPMKSEPAKKPERPKTATTNQPTTKPSGPARPLSTQSKKPPTVAKGPGRDIKDGPPSSVAKPSSAKPPPSRTGGVTTKPSRPPSAKPNDSGSEVAKKAAARPQSTKPKVTASTTIARKTVTTTTTVTQNGAASMKMQTSTKTVTEEKNGHQKTTVKKDVNGKTSVKEKTKTPATRPASLAKKAIDAKPAVGVAKAKLGGKSTTAGKPSTKPAPKKKGGEAVEGKKDQTAKVEADSPTKEGTVLATDEVKEHSTTSEEKKLLEVVETPQDPQVELTPEEKSIDPMPDLYQGEQETESSEVSSEMVVVSSRTTTETIFKDGEEVITTTEEATFEQTVGGS